MFVFKNQLAKFSKFKIRLWRALRILLQHTAGWNTALTSYTSVHFQHTGPSLHHALSHTNPSRKHNSPFTGEKLRPGRRRELSKAGQLVRQRLILNSGLAAPPFVLLWLVVCNVDSTVHSDWGNSNTYTVTGPSEAFPHSRPRKDYDGGHQKSTSRSSPASVLPQPL